MVTKLDELNINDWIELELENNWTYGRVVFFTYPFDENMMKATVEFDDGMKVEIDEKSDFKKVSEWQTKRLEEIRQNKEDVRKEVSKIKVPDHYRGSSDIDLIEFFYQQWGLEALRAVTSFNIQRYALRLGRKDEETKELSKIIDYAERFIEKKEVHND